MLKKLIVSSGSFIVTFISCLQATDTPLRERPAEMNISAPGTKLIARFEGFRETVYTCPGGKCTIGYGHVLKEGEKDKFSSSITIKEGEEILYNDVINNYVPDIQRLVKVPLTQGEFDALTSFDYNLGAPNLGNSTLLKYLNNGQRFESSLQFPLWRNANGKYLPGLFKRRVAEMLIFRDDDKIPDELKTIATKDGSNLLEVYGQLSESLKKEIQSIYISYKNEWRG